MSDSDLNLFKGIALFTPAGDVIYCIDPEKQKRWHLNLCTALQETLNLPEPPHFLVPGYTATLDRWLDPQTQQVQITAEVYPPVQRHQALLNAIFGTENLIWQLAPWTEETCNPLILETHRSRFPALWEEQDLILRYTSEDESGDRESEFNAESVPANYVLRLFVSGDSATVERTLERVHRILEQGLRSPYTLKVVNIFKHPEQAELNQVTATPTLVRILPQPVRRIVGDFDDTERVLQIITA
ncbi:MAG: circadian clock KaiB family protein [Jaaginema sp. PMC 1079.18]|nr:circadian clock KaiB family protein [Jaaginema sp. PMC 1080.18]MEC4850546.1 circadian clock KaiB family protein [Jaaginema sp. PMC 1079.18]MEC4867662.1 circadian clock KaiB family protein [Jaaginema sp. PMC 1078.18]